MSYFNFASDVNASQQQFLESEALAGLNATRYLSVAGTVLLFYDLILLLPGEITLIWSAKLSIYKVLFLINRYLILIPFVFNTHTLGITSDLYIVSSFYYINFRIFRKAPISCGLWYPFMAALGVTSLAIANFFVAHRIYFLSGNNQTIKRIFIYSFISIYTVTYISVILTSLQVETKIEFSPILNSCLIMEKPRFLVMTYGVPILLDVLVFLLACYNAFDRPRGVDSFLIRQLITDGLIYFMLLLSLRLFNILSIILGGVQFTQLGAFFIWATISTLVNRLIITRGVPDEEPEDGLDGGVYNSVVWTTFLFQSQSYEAPQFPCYSYDSVTYHMQ